MVHSRGSFFNLILCLCSFIIITQPVRGEVFGSIHDMEVLATLEDLLMTNLTSYIENQQERLGLLRTKLEQLKKVRPPEQSVEEVIRDPINAYTLVRRLAREWPLILNLMMDNFDYVSLLPKEENLNHAKQGLAKLQNVYGIDSRRLVTGTEPGTSLTAFDCFEFGKYMFEDKKYEYAESWLTIALEKIAEDDRTVEEYEVLIYLFLATLYSGCQTRAKSGIAPNILKTLMSQYSNRTLNKESSPLFIQTLSGYCPELAEVTQSEEDNDSMYNKACQGLKQSYSSETKCFYVHHNNPRLLIAPFKMEEINIDPPLLMFHDVISDQEIGGMMTAFKKVRESCKVNDGDFVQSTRACDVGWVYDRDSETAAMLTRRVGDMTDLHIASSEPNQVASYGIGGKFILHNDVNTNTNYDSSPEGSRLATFMFYLNDVEMGGNTVFPLIQKALKPAKGSAVFWFNIDHSSSFLKPMLHGGCPVIRGSKWVLNKWIHEGGQVSEKYCPADMKFPKPRFYLNGIK